MCYIFSSLFCLISYKHVGHALLLNGKILKFSDIVEGGSEKGAEEGEREAEKLSDLIVKLMTMSISSGRSISNQKRNLVIRLITSQCPIDGNSDHLL